MISLDDRRMLSQVSLRRLITRRFCKAVSFTESEFDSRALTELQRVADVIDSRMESIGADAVDYQEGVLIIEFPKGTFVLNKHTASRQIWYSSPVSSPAYFEPLTSSGKRWWSVRLQVSLSGMFSLDIYKLTGKRIDIEE